MYLFKITFKHNGFSHYKTFRELFKDLYYTYLLIDETNRKQNEFDGVLGVLSIYSAKRKEYIQAKNNLLKGSKMEFFRLFMKKKKNKSIGIKQKKNDQRWKSLKRLIGLKNRDINDELVRKNFRIQNLEKLKNSKNNTEKNNTQINLIKSGLRDLK